MRPLELTMSAFCSYKNKQVIDFRLLGRSGLYLITGDTGAGKTTIFDAISYALFGDASGNSRNPKMLRSEYASADTPTFVELVFEYNGKEYTVRRNPEYERLSKRGDGTTKQTADAHLILPNGQPPISKVNEVTKYIEELLGVNRDQFSQIAMLAQGEFRRLLLAESKDRRDIFRKLFHTQKYNELSDFLRSEANQLHNKCNDAENSVRQYIDGILCHEDDALFLSIAELKNNEKPAKEALEILANLNSRDEKNIQLLSGKLDTLDKQFAEVEAIFRGHEEAQKAKEQLNAKKSLLSQKNANLDEAKKTMEKALTKQSQADDMRKTATSLGKDLDLYAEREDCKIKCKNFKDKYVACLFHEKELEKQYDDLQSAIKKLKSEQTKYGGLVDKKAELVNKRAAFAVQKSSLAKIDDEIQELTNLRAKQIELASLYSKAKKAYKESSLRYARLQTEFLDAQAGILAQDLKDNEKCPVCGSLEHPHLAALPDAAPTKSDLDKAKNTCEKSEANVKDANFAFVEHISKISVLEDSLASLAAEFTDETNLDKALRIVDVISAEVKIESSSIDKELKSIDDKLGRNEEITGLIEQKMVESKTIMDEIANQKVKKGVLETTIDSLEARSEELASKLSYPSIGEARAEIKKLQFEASQIITTIKTTTEVYNALLQEIAELNGTISELKKQIEKSPQIDKVKLESDREKLEKEKAAQKSAYETTSNRLSANKRTYDYLVQSFKHSAELSQRYEWVRNLSDTANGTLKGRDKIMLEIYVQTRFFDKIIQRANTRFFQMTNGHFELKRAESTVNKTSQAGLDLNVIDHYNGSERSVKSLSGGESFMASLSLALGLSDEIQASAGGIRLDTMFIDEGFGSLDAETLRQAMDALSALADPAGGKLVGIISHVEELKTRIDKQIVVTKDKTGASTAKIIY